MENMNMFSAKKIIVRYLIPPILFSSYVCADTLVDKTVKDAMLFENQKEQYKKMEERGNENILYYETEKPTVEDTKEGRCIEIRKITEETITLLSEREKEAIFQPYEGTCRTLAELNNLKKELTGLYIDKGYVTSRVYFKPQRMDHGVLEIHAVEGKVSKILPKERYIKNAFLGQEDDFLNLRNLEDSVETINRLPSNHARLKLIPGNYTGSTIVQIDNNTTNRVHGKIGLDNFGNGTTGRIQGDLELNIDDPLGLNDQFSLYLNTTDQHTANQNAKGSGYKYALPIGGKLTTAFEYRKFSYRQLVHAGVIDYESTGHTSTYTLNVGYKLFHNQNNRITAGVTVSHYKTKNFISDALIDTSSYNLSKAAASIDYLYQVPGFYAFMAFAYTKGTKWFGDHNPTDLDSRFSLYKIDLSLMKRILSLNYTLNAHYQHTNDALFVIDQISIGGPYSVRGYKKEGLSGNTGYFARNELARKLEMKVFDVFDQTYFAAFDAGWIQKEEDVDGGKLMSCSFGARYVKGNLSAELYYAIPLRHKDVMQTRRFIGTSIAYRY